MKILVDELPKRKKDCSFCMDFTEICKLSGMPCILYYTDICPYLKEHKQFVDDGK